MVIQRIIEILLCIPSIPFVDGLERCFAQRGGRLWLCILALLLSPHCRARFTLPGW